MARRLASFQKARMADEKDIGAPLLCGRLTHPQHATQESGFVFKNIPLGFLESNSGEKMRDFQIPGRSPVYAANGMCATSHPLAARAAIDVLKSGGNAVDAAIAGAVLLGFCEPQMTGLGGDCFVLFKPAGTEEIHALNGSGRAPNGLNAAALRARGMAEMPLYSPEAVTIPGAVDAFCRLSADWGRMSLADTLAPAIQYAEEGVPVAPRRQRLGRGRTQAAGPRPRNAASGWQGPVLGSDIPRARTGRSAAPYRAPRPRRLL